VTHRLFDGIDLLLGAPYLTQQFGFGNHTAPIFNEELQGCKGFRGKLELFRATSQSAELPVQLEFAEAKHRLVRAIGFQRQIQLHSGYFQRLDSAFSARKATQVF
jgi:hypothetical protein